MKLETDILQNHVAVLNFETCEIEILELPDPDMDYEEIEDFLSEKFSLNNIQFMSGDLKLTVASS